MIFLLDGAGTSSPFRSNPHVPGLVCRVRVVPWALGIGRVRVQG